MSVYTVVARAELEAFLGGYALGELRDYAGIEAGIENTNYFVTTSHGEYVLTLFEVTPVEDLDFCLALMAHLADAGIPSAHPLADRDARYLGVLCGKPAALVQRLPGRSVSRPGIDHCRAIGAAMAHMHLAGASFKRARAAERGRRWRETVFARLRPVVGGAERALLDAVAGDAELAERRDLPNAVIHADLFHDNALFVDTRLTGIIDFYYAHTGALVYDLAVTVADWCFDAGSFDVIRARAVLQAYTAVRPVTAAEQAAWPAAMRAAGTRFWLSRLHDQCFPRAGALTHIKDPAPFRAVVEFALDHPRLLADAWD
ncbi:MAG: homoserine kinase [Gammaproteobacteria bacterium]